MGLSVPCVNDIKCRRVRLCEDYLTYMVMGLTISNDLDHTPYINENVVTRTVCTNVH